MVSEKINIRDKHRTLKKIGKVVFIMGLIFVILLIAFLGGSFVTKGSTTSKPEIVFNNPLQNIVFANTNDQGEVDKEKVIEQAVADFDKNYINYILAALGVNYLHKGIGFGNPLIEMIVGDESWSSEIVNGKIVTNKGDSEDEDLRIKISKKEAVESLLANDIKKFMKESVVSGRTEIEMVAGELELFSKGYLEMYNKITGEEESGDEELGDEDVENLEEEDLRDELDKYNIDEDFLSLHNLTLEDLKNLSSEQLEELGLLTV